MKESLKTSLLYVVSANAPVFILILASGPLTPEPSDAYEPEAATRAPEACVRSPAKLFIPFLVAELAALSSVCSWD
jgi:hypothetical protein